MPRVCSICSHPEHEAIDLALVDEALSLRTIADRFSISKTALIRHKSEHLPTVLATAPLIGEAVRSVSSPAVPDQPDRATPAAGALAERHETERAHAINVMAELVRQVERVNLISDACDRWLRDPDDETRYEIGPRGQDVTVVYWGIGRDGKQKRKKTTLDAAMLRLEGGGTVTDGAEYKMADPRKLVLDAATALHAQMSLVVTVLDKLYNAQEIERFEATVLEAIGEAAPDVRATIDESLRRRQPLRRTLGQGSA